MITLSDEEWKLLSDLFTAHFGLIFPPARRDMLEFRLRARVQALHLASFGEYYRYLARHPDRDAELRELPRVITNSETYFFREAHQFEILTDHVVPQLSRPPGRPLRVLSAGCSSGDEVYSIVISLQNAGIGRLGTAAWKVDACDLNPVRVLQAQEGVYDAAALRACDEAMRKLYFEEKDGRYVLRPRHREGARFFEANLIGAEPDLPNAPYDVIFCRNVLIYFSDEAFDQAISRFNGWLMPGGYLFLGHAESLIGRRDDFRPVRTGSSIIYQKVRSP
jgi:chemotaxis protein methyltransferase CheR